MKIGFDAKRLYNNKTGLGNYSRTLVKNLKKYFPENDYNLYTTKIKKNPENLGFEALKNHEPDTIFKSYWRSFSIIKTLKKHKIEIFHGLSNEIPFNIQKTNIKSVVTIHDLIFKIYPKTYAPIERFIYDLKFKYACKKADKIIAISENTKNDIVKLYNINPEKIEVIYQSCNPIFFELKSAEANLQAVKNYNLPEKYFLYVGSVEPRKNLKNIIEAYDFLSEACKIPLVIIGKGGKYEIEMKKLIQSKKLEGYFIWLTNLHDNNHLQSIYQSAQALVYPSFYEGFGIPIIEALLSKLPVISANTSSLMEAGGPNSIYINPNEPEEIASAMEKILDDKTFTENMINNGFEYAKNKFESKLVSTQLINLYQNLIN